MQPIPTFAGRRDPTPLCDAVLADLFCGFEPPGPDPAWLLDDGGPWWVTEQGLTEVYAACHPAYVAPQCVAAATWPPAGAEMVLREPSAELVPMLPRRAHWPPATVEPYADDSPATDDQLERLIARLADLDSWPDDVNGELVSVVDEPTQAWNVRREEWDREPPEVSEGELVGVALLPISHEPHALPKVVRPRGWRRKGRQGRAR